jgi:hypothetical protein
MMGKRIEKERQSLYASSQARHRRANPRERFRREAVNHVLALL